MTLQEYEEKYCTYCDSQRCNAYVGEDVSKICPYWNERMKREEEDNGESNKSNK